jgi:hypothetical protein
MQVPFQRYGTWIIAESQIPVDKAIGSTPIFSTFQNPELSSFNNIFSSPEGRRGRLSEVAASQILSRMEAARNRASATMAIQCNEDEGTVVVPPSPKEVVEGHAPGMQHTHVERQTPTGENIARSQHVTDDSILQLQARETEQDTHRCVEDMDFEYLQSQQQNQSPFQMMQQLETAGILPYTLSEEAHVIQNNYGPAKGKNPLPASASQASTSCKPKPNCPGPTAPSASKHLAGTNVFHPQHSQFEQSPADKLHFRDAASPLITASLPPQVGERIADDVSENNKHLLKTKD